MRFKTLFIAFWALLALMGAAYATARIHIDLSSQRMHVTSSQGSYSWPVSTARAGYYTPRGSFAPTGMQLMHYSRKYHMSPMPYSIFFRGGYAIHGTYATGALGSPASHGCVRLSPGNAATLYHLVQSEGGSISISGSPPGGKRYAKAFKRHGAHYAARSSGRRHVASRAGKSHAMSYAPTRHHRHQSVRAWQSHPLSGF
jgi:hypothetical protein